MGLRFRRSIKIAPGLRMNFSLAGIGYTLGARGMSVGVGKNGTALNVGVPGTGLSYRQQISSSKLVNRTTKNERVTKELSLVVGFTDEGDLTFQDEDGQALAPELIKVAKSQQREVLQKFVEQKCEEINSVIEALQSIHLNTPSPSTTPRYQEKVFSVLPPAKPERKTTGILGAVFKSVRNKIEIENKARLKNFQEETKKWQEDKSIFDRAESERKDLISRAIYCDTDAMSRFLEQNLQLIVWPRETDISFELLDGGKIVFIDVDLPELEDFPNKAASVQVRACRLSYKEMSERQLQQLYMSHIHGAAFRIIGEVFASLPKSETIVLSGYSQRANKATGQLEDQYLYSVRVQRTIWANIDFDNLGSLDPVEALAQFDLKRDMTKTGVFKPVEPYDPINSIDRLVKNDT